MKILKLVILVSVFLIAGSQHKLHIPVTYGKTYPGGLSIYISAQQPSSGWTTRSIPLKATITSFSQDRMGAKLKWILNKDVDIVTGHIEEFVDLPAGVAVERHITIMAPLSGNQQIVAQVFWTDANGNTIGAVAQHDTEGGAQRNLQPRSKATRKEKPRLLQ